jgi:phosphatidylserine/phosphatidylglycerophosphate/cardiolipin synthase-like enzyme
VITGSANYSKNSTEKNDENTLVLHRDERVAQMYLGEFFRIYEHYRSRWFLNRARKAPEELTLAKDGSWAQKYYGKTDSARFLRLLLA